MEVRYREKEQAICDMRSEKSELEHHLSKMTEDLHRCMRALHTIASVEMANDGGGISQVIRGLYFLWGYMGLTSNPVCFALLTIGDISKNWNGELLGSPFIIFYHILYKFYNILNGKL